MGFALHFSLLIVFFYTQLSNANRRWGRHQLGSVGAGSSAVSIRLEVYLHVCLQWLAVQEFSLHGTAGLLLFHTVLSRRLLERVYAVPSSPWRGSLCH